MASTRATTLLLLALAGAATAGPFPQRLQLQGDGEPLLQAFVPQEPAALNPGRGPEDRQSDVGFQPATPQFQAGAPLPREAPPGRARRRRRQIAQKLSDMLNAPYSGRLPSDLQPLMRQSIERTQHVQQFNAIRRSQQVEPLSQRPAFKPGPQGDPQIDRLALPAFTETVDPFSAPQDFGPEPELRPQEDSHQQQDFRPAEEDFRPDQSSRPDQSFNPEGDAPPDQRFHAEEDFHHDQSFRPHQDFRPEQNSRPKEDFRPDQSFRPHQDFRPEQNSRPEEDFRPDQSFRPQQDFRPEPEFRRRPRPARRPQSDGFIPDNGGLPTRLFSNIRRTIFGGRAQSRQKRSTAIDESGNGFFQMPPGFPSMGSLQGFSDQFQDAPQNVNDIDVPGIEFPASPFQARVDEEEQQEFQEEPPTRRQRRDLRRVRRSPPYPRGGWRRNVRDYSQHGPTYPAYPVPDRQRHDPSSNSRYQLPLSPVPHRAPFDEARHPVLPPPPPPARASPTSPRPGFLEGFSEPFRAQERSSLLGSGNYVILRGGSFVDDYDYLDNHVSARPYQHAGHRPGTIDNFRDFAEFAHGSDPAYSLALPERRMSTAETSTAPVSTPFEDVTRQSTPDMGAAEEGGLMESAAEESGSREGAEEDGTSGAVQSRQAASIQEILSGISNDVHADPLPDSGTSHVKKRVLKDKRLLLRRQRQKQAAQLGGRGTASPEPSDPMVATF